MQKYKLPLLCRGVCGELFNNRNQITCVGALWFLAMAKIEGHSEEVIQLKCNSSKELASPKLAIKLQLKSLILAQIERWRYA